MNEIELKAHVYDRDSLVKKLNAFAEFKTSLTRDDLYYYNPSVSKKSIRIRRETENGNCRILLTYKRKELRDGENGVQIEVNEEKECTMTSADPLESFFKDSGYEIKTKKHKEVTDWEYTINGFKCTIELCNVPPLGDFIELEILSESGDKETVSKARDSLFEILDLCGIDRSCIENRYYSDLLKQNEKKGGKHV